MDLPKDVILKVVLRPGAILLYKDDAFPDKAHFFVIINMTILYNQPLFLLCATSQVVKKQAFISSRNLPLETLVIVHPADCNFLKKETVFNCNSVLERPIEMIKEKIDNSEIKKYAEVTGDILGKLRNGVLISPLVPEKIKRIIKKKY